MASDFSAIKFIAILSKLFIFVFKKYFWKKVIFYFKLIFLDQFNVTISKINLK
jgi:hypothetical protein